MDRLPAPERENSLHFVEGEGEGEGEGERERGSVQKTTKDVGALGPDVLRLFRCSVTGVDQR
jgi:hypothetical protein